MNNEPLIVECTEGQELPDGSCAIIDDNSRVVDLHTMYVKKCAKGILGKLSIYREYDCVSGLKCILKKEPNFCLLDHEMPYGDELFKGEKITNGTHILNILQEVKSKTKIILVTSYPNEFDNGIINNENFLGILLKKEKSKIILSRIRDLIRLSTSIVKVEKNIDPDDPYDSKVIDSFLNIVENECDRLMLGMQSIIENKLINNSTDISDSIILNKILNFMYYKLIPNFQKKVNNEFDDKKKLFLENVLRSLVIEFDLLRKQFNEIGEVIFSKNLEFGLIQS